jgi:3-hydroxy-3-methylglutaryl CoA synthase
VWEFYPKGDSAECTQGAGAVAMHVCASPRLLELQGLDWPPISVDERDFFRPNWSSEAVVDGRYSVDVYLACLDWALRASLQREPRVALGCERSERRIDVGYRYYDYVPGA